MLDPVTRIEQDRNIATRIAHHNPGHPWLTLPKALEEVDELLTSATSTDQSFLIEHRNYLFQRLNRSLAIL